MLRKFLIGASPCKGKVFIFESTKFSSSESIWSQTLFHVKPETVIKHFFNVFFSVITVRRLSLVK